MRAVQLTVRRAAFVDAMAAMREWLDHNSDPAVRFETAKAKRGILISVEFSSDDLAEAFQRRFGGALSAATC